MKTLMRAGGTLQRGGMAALSLAAAILLSGCAGMGKSPDEIVVERAQARWEAVIRRDYETAYPYYTPGYRSSTSLVDYAIALKTRRVNWTSAEYVDHECEEARCTVRFNIGYRVVAPIPGMPKFDGKQPVEDTWVRTGGQWWYLPPKD